MFWQTALTCTLAALAGGIAFWLVKTFRVQPAFLIAPGPIIMAIPLMPPDIAASLIAGAWLAVAVFRRAHEGIPVPNEGIGWRLVVRDAVGVSVALLVAMIYLYRQRRSTSPGGVLTLGLLLAAILVLCYFHAVAWDIPRQIRVKHGYAVGLLSFIPQSFIMMKQGWTVLSLSFLTLLFLPPFFLATVDLNLSLPQFKRRRHHRARSNIRLPRR